MSIRDRITAAPKQVGRKVRLRDEKREDGSWLLLWAYLDTEGHLHITRQTNVFIPTQGYFMAALGILKIPWEKWVRWLLPLLLIWLALGMAAVVIAQAIHLGPF
jgi:hypothetical protein